jgi:PAS domain S-box-containing protein
VTNGSLIVSLPTDVLFQNAFESAAIGMALVAPDGRWLRVNRSVCEITGYTEEELLQRSFQDLTHPEDLALDLQNVRRLLEREVPSYQMEKRYLHKDGSVVWVTLSVSVVFRGDGEPLFLMSQIQDITARKASEEKLAAADAEIRRLRKELLKVCAWTKRIKVDGRWMPVEEFLSQHLQLRLAQEMSEEAVRLFGYQSKLSPQ